MPASGIMGNDLFEVVEVKVEDALCALCALGGSWLDAGGGVGRLDVACIVVFRSSVLSGSATSWRPREPFGLSPPMMTSWKLI